MSNSPYYYESARPTPAESGSGVEGAGDATDGSEGSEGGLPAPGDGDGMAVIEIDVPENAKVFVNGKRTTSTGTERKFVSRGLQRGYTYTYTIRVEDEIDGQLVTETKTVRVTAGQDAKLAFQLQKEFETVLTLNVPEDAEVFLGGNRTKATGNVRIYRTKALQRGDAWEDYQIRVVVKRDGKPVVREQSISVNAGDNKALTFDFDTSNDNLKVAANP